ncbi:MAG: hypothetical protein K6B69_06250 [Lachnospiraceae bacterium]|nr:hypothetical protein [Lachnospiraceae bacterium]
MKLELTLQQLIPQIKKRFMKWLIVSIVAGLLVLGFHYMILPERNHVVGVINFSFSGIESGRSPIGNRFDPDEMRHAEVIHAAGLTAMGQSYTAEGVEMIRKCIHISSGAPLSALSDIVDYQTTIGSDKVSMTTEVRKTSYYPTRYTLRFDYAAVGFTRSQGAAFLQALMDEYQTRFMNEYGYNASIERSMRAFDYQDYDYDNAVQVLDSDLRLLGNYLNSLNAMDSARFVSTQTGYSFADLSDAVQTIRSEDLARIRSYLNTYCITRSKEEKINFYNFKIRSVERDIEVEQKQLETIGELIENYEKTTAVIAGNTSTRQLEEGEMPVLYEVTQHSDTYDGLVSRKISSEARISSMKEQLDRYKELVKRYRNSVAGGSAEQVETMLQEASAKTDVLLDAAAVTAKEYYETVRMRQPMQVLTAPGDGGFPLGALIRSSMQDGIAVEALVFGVWILFSLIAVYVPEKTKMKKAVTSAAVKTEEKEGEPDGRE